MNSDSLHCYHSSISSRTLEHLHIRTASIDDPFPYYVTVSCGAPPVVRFPEHGFSIEEALFGEIVGVVFDDEIKSAPPLFFQSDFTKISRLFLHCRDGMTYRLGIWSLCLGSLRSFA